MPATQSNAVKAVAASFCMKVLRLSIVISNPNDVEASVVVVVMVSMFAWANDVPAARAIPSMARTNIRLIYIIRVSSFYVAWCVALCCSYGLLLRLALACLLLAAPCAPSHPEIGKNFQTY